MDKPADCASPIVSSVAFKGKGMSLRRSELELSNEKKKLSIFLKVCYRVKMVGEDHTQS